MNIITFSPLPSTREDEQIEERKIRAAACCRVSSGSEEQLASFVRQVSYYREYLDECQEYTNCGIYADEGISGTGTSKRSEFLQMMQDCRDGKLDLIFTNSVSRFGRNTVDCLESVRELRGLDVEVFFEKENIHSKSGEGELMLTLMAAIAESECFQMSENIKWGLQRKYESGSVKSVGLGKCLGYGKDEDGNIVIVEQEAAIIRRIYQDFLDGLSLSRIAEGLEKDGILSDQGNVTWNPSSLRKMLGNELLKGDIRFQKTYSSNPLTQKRVKNRGGLAQYYLEGSHPPIIDPETWEMVQLEIARQEAYCREHRITRYHHHNEENPLSARITCSVCGSTYIMLRPKNEED